MFKIFQYMSIITPIIYLFVCVPVSSGWTPIASFKLWSFTTFITEMLILYMYSSWKKRCKD